MTKYREILRLQSLGFSERNIAQSCGVSRNTVAKVLKKAAEINISWPLDFDMTDSALEELMFPRISQQQINACLTLTTFAKNFCEMESTKSFSG